MVVRPPEECVLNASWVLSTYIGVSHEQFDSRKRGATRKDIVFYQLSGRTERPHAGKMTSTTQDLQGGRAPSWGTGTSLDDAERLCHFGQDVCRAQQLFPLMGRADDGAKPRLAFRHDRVTNGGSKDTRFKKFFREFERLRRVAHVNRNDRRLARFELKPALLQFALEHFRVGPQFLHQLFAFRRIEQRERRLASRRRSRRVRSRKKKWPRPQIQKIDQVARAANVPAHRAYRLAQCPHLDVHAPVALVMVYRSTASASQHA